MSSSINTACRSPRAERGRSLRALLAGVCAAGMVWAAATGYAQDADLRAPSAPVAGNPAAIATTGGGTATFYLVGPNLSLKRDVPLGQEISLSAKELESAGNYLAIVCSGTCRSVGFFVAPAKPVSLTFLVHPSRAPVGQNNVVSGVALPFDEFHNLVLAPASIDFQWTAKGAAPLSHQVSTENGVAWFHTSSGRSAGALQVTASIHEVISRRVVEQVASDPCSLHIQGQRTAKGVVLETEPVRDCAGNPVPDGTIVSFTAKSGSGKDTSTVDAPIKQGIARAQITAAGAVVVSAASGVVMGNELRMGAR
jgi:hypothetical protein